MKMKTHFFPAILLVLFFVLLFHYSIGETIVSEDMSREEVLDLIESKINSNTSSKLIFAEEFNPVDKNNGHYRTEFRLYKNDDVYGYSYTYGNASFDVIILDDLFDKNQVRLYVDGATIDECCEIVETIAPLLDAEVTSEDIQDTIDYLRENEEANGYYLSNLKILLLGKYRGSYEFMLSVF